MRSTSLVKHIGKTITAVLRSNYQIQTPNSSDTMSYFNMPYNLNTLCGVLADVNDSEITISNGDFEYLVSCEDILYIIAEKSK